MTAPTNPTPSPSAIQRLDPELIAQIAAGETIERPASIVKELLENALDAGATRVQIQLEKGGASAIVVADNGCGISREDLAVAVEHHTTSKIASLADLQRGGSFGFRGEALYSIGTVAQLQIRSRPADSIKGAQIRVAYGTVSARETVATAPGTTVTVTDLFQGMPARRRFLRAPASELRLISQICTDLAVVHPQVAIRLVHEGRLILDLSPVTRWQDRAGQILGKDLSVEMIPVLSESSAQLEALIEHPLSSGRYGRRIIIVNGRPVTAPGVVQAVRQAYGTLLEQRAQPTCVVQISLPPAAVDHNVHPRKTEVLIQDQNALFAQITAAVNASLVEYGLIHEGRSSMQEKTGAGLVRDGGTTGYAAEQLRTGLPVTGVASLQSKDDYAVTQIHDLYLLVETEEGVLLVDQHAAHERVMYERYKTQFHAEAAASMAVPMSPAVSLEVGTDDLLLLQQQKETLAELGFEIEFFGQTGIKVVSLPGLIADRDPATVIAELVSDLRADDAAALIDRKSHRMILYLACRGAIKAGDRLSSAEARQLIKDLAQCEIPHTCPHGRPTQVHLRLQELGRLFGRS